ncbi:transposase [Caballeronia sp. LjRoot34]|uniref:IS66-like element accessory protein TnpA n=1 Tax=Caballeronia sp. LjRoot34 TaxID=3342325 RepID=UPI003ECC9C78
MTHDDLSFLPLRATRVGVGGRRSFDPVDKQRLIEACLQPGASLSGLALKAGVNANQLCKWIRLHERSNTPMREGTACASSAFVPVVVAIDDRTPVPAAQPVPERESSHLSPRSVRSARLSAQLPNGVKIELECTTGDAGLVAAMVSALGAH